LHMS